jgi:hypothetical protein
MEQTTTNGDSQATTTTVANPDAAAANEQDMKHPANDPSKGEAEGVSEQALAELARRRTFDASQAREQMGLENAIEGTQTRNRATVGGTSGEKDDSSPENPKSPRDTEVHISSSDSDAERDNKARHAFAALEKKYLHSDENYYFRGRENALAFSDKGKNIATPHNDPDVVRSMVELAEAKGWDSIKLKGNDEAFKREAWFQASLKGMDVQGYKPKDVDIARLEDARASMGKGENRIEQGRAPEVERSTQPQKEKGTGQEEKFSRTEKQQPMTPAKQIAEVARTAAAKKGYSTEVQAAVAKAAQARVEGLERTGKTASMLKFDQTAERTQQVTRVAPNMAPSRAPKER